MVKEADVLFFTEKKYRDAQIKYVEALAIREDITVRDKVRDCVSRIDEQYEIDKREKDNLKQDKHDYHVKKDKAIHSHFPGVLNFL